MTASEGRKLRLFVLCMVIAGLVFPIAAGLGGTLAAAFGYLPAVGAYALSLDPWRDLAGLPGIGTSLALTIFTGLSATFLALILAFGLCAARPDWMTAGRAARLLAPLLATPHAAMAIGLAFVIAPSGWLARMVSPWATGWNLPPELATVHDPMGLALILGLLIKEVPFFLLVILAALSQLPVRDQVRAGRALGYGRGLVWAKVVFPQVYPLIRLPIYVVLAFSLSVVDMAIILGPSNPPVLSVAVTRWFFSADIEMLLLASAGAILQAAVVIGAIAFWRLAEVVLGRAGLWWLRIGQRGLAGGPGPRLAAGLTLGVMLLGALALVAMLVWSFAWRWPFPLALPQGWSLAGWMRPDTGWGRASLATLGLALATTILSLSLAICWLEGEDRAHLPRAGWAEMLIYLPLLVPQVAFLYGMNVLLLSMGLTGGYLTVTWAQTLFVFPYVMIALSDPWRALDPRPLRVAASLGAGPYRRLIAVKLPLLLRPLLTAAAIGFAVSVAQYLPTLFMGAGRVATLTTEAVTLSSGSDRRIVGIYAVLQLAMPLAVYAIALMLPTGLYRHRRGMAEGAR
jgi:putative thiamine transport system permease protein